MLLAEMTGWSEEVILGLPIDRLNSYVRELNKIKAERNGEEPI